MLFIFEKKIIKTFLISVAIVSVFFLILIFSITSVESKKIVAIASYNLFFLNLLMSVDDLLRIYDIVILASCILFSFKMIRDMNIAILEFYGLSKLRIFRIVFIVIGIIAFLNLLIFKPYIKYKISGIKKTNMSQSSREIKFIDIISKNLSYINFANRVPKDKGNTYNYSKFLSIENLNNVSDKIFYAKKAVFERNSWILQDGFMIDLLNKKVDSFSSYKIQSSFKKESNIENKNNENKAEYLSFYNKISLFISNSMNKIKNDQTESVKIMILYDIIEIIMLFFNFAIVLVFNFSFERMKHYLTAIIKIFISFLFLKNLIWLSESIVRQYTYIDFVMIIPPSIALALTLFIVYAKDLKNEKALKYVS